MDQGRAAMIPASDTVKDSPSFWQPSTGSVRAERKATLRLAALAPEVRLVCGDEYSDDADDDRAETDDRFRAG